jgi:hypothetical protein
MGNLIGGIFSSPPRSGKIVHVGDIQLISRFYPQYYPRISAAIIHMAPDLVIFTGDTGELGTAAEWLAFKGFYDASVSCHQTSKFD